MLKIGSHVSMTSPDYLLAAIKESVSYNSNAMMIYSGAPQNTRRIPVSRFKINEAQAYMEEVGFNPENIVLHAPYIINLANTTKPEVFELAVEFLDKEIDRALEMGINKIVLHPGSHVQQGEEVGIAQIIKGLNRVLDQRESHNIVIALETMAGKGSEIGYNFEQLKAIYDGVNKKQHIGFTLDTCHIHDAGYNLDDFDAVLDEFDEIIGLQHLQVIHVNDSKNVRGARKDRHANIGYGEIGFQQLLSVFYNPRLDHLVKILETPWIDNKPPYKEEIESIRQQTFDPMLFEKVQASE
ncbi:MAG: deoxyribonuclease IV [Erysipelothrix sp.]|nr:deoxyribonuclease IV [Erysipelothrix sp.]